MGTSKSYKASIKNQPQWGELSSSVTSSCGKGVVSDEKLVAITSRYVSVIGGSGNAGRGNSKIAGRAGIRTVKGLGAFLSAFSSSGGDLSKTMATLGISGLVGKTSGEIIDRLIEYCSGPSSTIDDVAAKTAAQKILEEIASDALTVEELQEKLKDVLSKESIEDVLIRFFGYYIFEHLSIMFYEKLVVEKGKSDCDDLFKQIKEFIFERLKNVNRTNPLDKIDWKGPDADRLVKNIQEDVLKIFE
jgi:hypothetical protein